jgi:hypothetical protein
MDLQTFKRVVYGVSGELGARVLKVRAPDVTPNFYVAEVEYVADYQTRTVCVLASYNDDWAFSSCLEEHACQLEFVNFGRFAKLMIERFGIKPLAKAELDAPFTPRSYLLESDVKYWQPRTLGEGLFNWWD